MSLSFKPFDKLDKYFPRNGCIVEVQPGRCILPIKFCELGESILNFPIYNDDIWLCSYPRTGSTWAQEMIWLLGNNLDFENAKLIQQIRSPLLELTALFSEDHYEWVANSIGNTVDAVRKMPRPRYTRSHLPWPLLPKQLDAIKPKIIYTARNPKDLCISYYHHCKHVHRMSNIDLNEFCELFLKEDSPMGSYWSHVLPFWERRNDSNILFLKYEEMKRNLTEVIKKCAKFLEIKYDLTDNDMIKISEHLKFDKMQNNPSVNFDPIIKNPLNYPDINKMVNLNLNNNQNNNNNNLDNNSNDNNNSTDNDNSNNSNSNTNNSNNDSNSKNNNNINNCNNFKFIRKGEIGDWKNYLSKELSDKFDKWIEANTSGTGLDFIYE